MEEFKLPSVQASNAVSEPQMAAEAPPLAYHVPLWSERPPKSLRYQLEVIFQGSIQQIIALDAKPFYLIGRLPFCDIVIDNDSVSRQHAVIQFRKNGEAFLYDLGSTHGTILNGGAPINPNTYKRLMAGDSIKFGSSSRTFVFEGGPDREEVVDEKRSEKKPTSNNPVSGKSVTSGATKPKSENSGTVIPQKKRRFAPLVSEKSEEDELDAEGRLEAQLTLNRGSKKNDDDEDGGNVSDEERDNAELEMVAGYLGRESIEGSDGEDSFFDRTLQSRSSSSLNPKIHKKIFPESYETVSSKIRVLGFVMSAVSERIRHLDQVIAKDVNRRNNGGNSATDDGQEIDALDAFLNGMSQTVEEEEEREKKVNVLKTLESEMEKLQKLEKQLKPAPGEIHATIVSAADLELLSDEYYNELVERVKLEGGSLKLQTKRAVPPETKKPKLAEAMPSPPLHSDIMPPPSRISTKSEDSEPFRKSNTTNDNISQPAFQGPRPMNPPDFPIPHPIQHSSDQPKMPQDEPKVLPNPKKRDRELSNGSDEFDDFNASAMWEAPKGQTGDGRTSLNDKYGY